MRKRRSIPGIKVKSFTLDSSYDAVYGGSEFDRPGEFTREPIVGFVLVAKGSAVCGERLWHDEVLPFEFCELGFYLCQSAHNFLGIVKGGSDIPPWMKEDIDNPEGDGSCR